MRTDVNDDQIHCSVALYKLFLAHQKQGGLDACLLYCHLQFTARHQKTNQVKANNTYLKNGLGWGDARVKRAKALLVRFGLIEYVKAIDEKTKQIKEWYIRLKFDKRASGSETDPVDQKSIPVDAHTDRSRKQMLKENKRNALREKGKGEPSALKESRPESRATALGGSSHGPRWTAPRPRTISNELEPKKGEPPAPKKERQNRQAENAKALRELRDEAGVEFAETAMDICRREGKPNFFADDIEKWKWKAREELEQRRIPEKEDTQMLLAEYHRDEIEVRKAREDGSGEKAMEEARKSQKWKSA